MSNLDTKQASRGFSRIHPFVVDFVKFSSGFVAVVAVGLLMLRAVGTAL